MAYFQFRRPQLYIWNGWGESRQILYTAIWAWSGLLKTCLYYWFYGPD